MRNKANSLRSLASFAAVRSRQGAKPAGPAFWAASPLAARPRSRCRLRICGSSLRAGVRTIVLDAAAEQGRHSLVNSGNIAGEGIGEVLAAKRDLYEVLQHSRAAAVCFGRRPGRRADRAQHPTFAAADSNSRTPCRCDCARSRVADRSAGATLVEPGLFRLAGDDSGSGCRSSIHTPPSRDCRIGPSTAWAAVGGQLYRIRTRQLGMPSQHRPGPRNAFWEHNCFTGDDPRDERVASAERHGAPLLVRHPHSGYAVAVERIASALLQEQSAAGELQRAA